MAEERDRYECSECAAVFAVVYDQVAAGGPPELTPVNCPVCGGINYVSVSLRAAESLNYWTLGERKDRYECLGCKEPFLVVYEAQPEEPSQMAAVRCPHCGWVNYASVARSALGVLDAWYRVEKLGEWEE